MARVEVLAVNDHEWTAPTPVRHWRTKANGATVTIASQSPGPDWHEVEVEASPRGDMPREVDFARRHKRAVR